MIQINGINVEETKYLYDGCHKIYLIDWKDLRQRAEAKERNWKVDDLHDIETIAECYKYSCPLRFIQRWSTFENIVPQCAEKAVFVINGIETTVENAEF